VRIQVSKTESVRIPEAEAGSLVADYVYIELPKLLAKDKKIGKKPEAEAFLIIHKHFENAVVQPAIAKAKFTWGAKPQGTEPGEADLGVTKAGPPWEVKPPFLEPGEIDPAEMGGPPGAHDKIPLRTFKIDVDREADLKGAYCIGLLWTGYKKSVPHLIIQHMLDNVSRGRVHWMEAFEILMIALGDCEEVRTPKREDQRLSEYQRRENKKQVDEYNKQKSPGDPLSLEHAEAARRIHDARVAFNREKSSKA
jgi:hypothetical protein